MTSFNVAKAAIFVWVFAITLTIFSPVMEFLLTPIELMVETITLAFDVLTEGTYAGVKVMFSFLVVGATIAIFITFLEAADHARTRGLSGYYVEPREDPPTTTRGLKEYPINTFGRGFPFVDDAQLAKGTTSEDCLNCGYSSNNPYEIVFGEETVFAGFIINREVLGVHYECEPCHEDPIEAALRREREDPEKPEIEAD